MNKWIWMLIGLLPIALSSCITVEETYSFKRNGSGTMKYVVDMSDLKPLLEMAGDEVEDPFADQDMDFGAMAEKVADIEGIKKVTAIEDEENLTFGVEFKFKNVDALNRALNALILDRGENDPQHEFIRKEGNTYTRTHKMGEDFDPSSMFGDDSEEGQMAMGMLESMEYHINMNFKRSVETVYSEAESEFNDDRRRELEVEVSFKDLIENPELLNLSVVTQ